MKLGGESRDAVVNQQKSERIQHFGAFVFPPGVWNVGEFAVAVSRPDAVRRAEQRKKLVDLEVGKLWQAPEILRCRILKWGDFVRMVGERCRF